MTREYIKTGEGTGKIVDSVEIEVDVKSLQALKESILARRQAALDEVEAKYAPELAEVQEKIDGLKAVGVEVTAEVTP